MNHHRAAEQRIGLACKIAPCYSCSPGIAAVAVAGSVSRGRADDCSDLEFRYEWVGRSQ